MSYNEWLDIDVLEDYLDGKLDAKTMHKIERMSLEDPFMAEALAGLSQSPKRTYTLSLLQKQLEERIAKKPIAEKRWRITAQRLSIAAAAAVLFVTVSILFWMKGNRQQVELAKHQKAAVETSTQVATNKPIVKTETPSQSLAAPHQRLNRVADPVPDRAVTASAPADETISAAPVASAAPPAAAAFVQDESKRNKITAEELSTAQAVAPLKKAENVRERALAGKAPGIIMESNLRPNQIPTVINGRVFAKVDGQPLPGAIVKVPGTNKAAVTDSKGEFTLSADSAIQSLSVGYIGYASQEVKTKVNQEVSIALEEDKTSLKEVVMADAKSKPIDPAPEYAKSSAYFPIGGWNNYQAYLTSNNTIDKQAPIGKTVGLKFEVRPNGAPTKITIVKSLGKKYDEAAIRLLKDGPRWLPVNKDKIGPGFLEVQF
ncbi:MAG: carboxypeptidase-like regulatory domain-containing protein [Pedobacter sp.]|nr:carboxypeptidase-like regulatory domain-containing protein [Pedobacter sp.]MDQ8052791.1 carboxypeptidase-like regulatory domain-containing protein [Pedobacter sp.]